MIFNVPQFIDVEDKVAGPLTAKQLFWMIVLGAILFLFWTIFEKGFFFALAIPTSVFFLALAFYRPYNQSFIKFLSFIIFFLFRPKIYVWKKEIMPEKEVPFKSKNKQKQNIVSKKIDYEQLKELAEKLDK